MASIVIELDESEISENSYMDILVQRWLDEQAVMNEEEGMSYKEGLDYAYKDFIGYVKGIKRQLVKHH